MPSFAPRPCLLVILSLLLPHIGSAQGPGKKGRTFRIACWSEWTQDELYIRLPKSKAGGGNAEKEDADAAKSFENMHKIEIFDMSYSKHYPYSPGKPLIFYKSTKDAEEPFAPVLQVVIPVTNNHPLVFLKLTKEKASHLLYDLDPKKFPYGSYKVVNFTPVPLMTELAGKRFVLKPKSSKLVDPGFKEKKALQCRVAVEEGNKPKVVYSNMLMNRPKKRMLMFFYPTKDEAGRPTVKCRSLVDFQPEPQNGGG